MSSVRLQSRPGDRGPYLRTIPSWHGQLERIYNKPMRTHIIGNPVPTPEQLGKILGVSSERVAAVRQIMDGSAKEKVRGRSKTTARKKSTRVRTSGRATGKR
jgi:hypothetical protein